MRTHDAAALLGVSPSTLRSWERRHGYPRPRRTPGNHRIYDLGELEALRDALGETGAISSAIDVAQRRGRAVGSVARLLNAFDRYDESAADREIEESLALRSVERSVDELLLPALAAAGERPARPAELEFACRWATGWLHGARKLAPSAWREEAVLILESDPGPHPDAVHAQALELILRRLGLRVLVLSTELASERVGAALGALRPSAVILCGVVNGGEERRATLEGVLRAPGGGRAFAYRGGLGSSRIARRLEDSPVRAAAAVLADIGD
ncbi:MAG: MerR family DNA-binding transcriptional regulator [Solirubrobacterales bacterium]